MNRGSFPLFQGTLSKELRRKLLDLLKKHNFDTSKIPVSEAFSVSLTEEGKIAAVYLTGQKVSNELTWDSIEFEKFINFIDQHLVLYSRSLPKDLCDWGNEAVQEAIQS